MAKWQSPHIHTQLTATPHSLALWEDAGGGAQLGVGHEGPQHTLPHGWLPQPHHTGLEHQQHVPKAQLWGDLVASHLQLHRGGGGGGEAWVGMA